MFAVSAHLHKIIDITRPTSLADVSTTHVLNVIVIVRNVKSFIRFHEEHV